jgi:hypothetical protein
MKISDFIFEYPTNLGSAGKAICRARIFVPAPEAVWVVLTDLGEKSIGSSITNSIEDIREHLFTKGFITNKAKLIEHYESNSHRDDTFDLVSFSDGVTPNWKSMQLSEACTLIDSEEREFASKTTENARLFDEIERIRHAYNPFIDSPSLEDPKVINRRADIQEKMISKASVSSLVGSGATERELQALLKTDLSFFADIYAKPEEEYICFSEFPVADGAVDFAIFFGRSRMDVVLIEIKGADFFLINRDSYGNFSAKINEAAQQIRKRLGHVYRNLDEFRKFAHTLRARVESGKPAYNSLVGPRGILGVDPNKDINIHCVVIGGRGANDLEESRMRHDFERGTSPPIKIESWDSWLKKIARD